MNRLQVNVRTALPLSVRSARRGRLPPWLPGGFVKNRANAALLGSCEASGMGSSLGNGKAEEKGVDSRNHDLLNQNIKT